MGLTANGEARVKKLKHWFKRLGALLPDRYSTRASELHLLEARERYYSLHALTEYHKKLIENNPNADEHKKIAIERCMNDLKGAEDLLTNKQRDLNNLWRCLTRVRILLFEKIFDTDMVITQLDFCREEAYRLGVENDPEVKDMLQKLAEATDEQGVRLKTIKRYTRALTERFNTIRSQRIYDQFIKICTYKRAFGLLMLLAVLVIGNAGLLVKDELGEPASSGFPAYTLFDYFCAQGYEGTDSSSTIDEVTSWLEGYRHFVVYHAIYLNQVFQQNVLAFVFVAGLVGGVFSVVMRVRNKERVPGEDAYFRYYVLTKPFVGALGAVIVFILFQSGFMELDMLNAENILQTSPGPGVFGFAFLSGFSERIVFPNFQ